MVPPQVQGFYIPEDVVHLIFEEIMSQGDRASFRTAALLSSTFLYVAQLHLYRSCKLNIGDPTSILNIIILLDIIESRPYIGTFIKEFSIVDIPQPEKKPLRQCYAVAKEANDISLQAHHQLHSHQNLIDIFTLNRHNLLPRLLRILSSLSTLNFSFQFSRLDWHTLHEDVRYALEGLFSLGHLITMRLNGVVNIPSSLSTDIFTFPEVEFNNCHFALFSPPIPLRKRKSTPDTGRRTHMRSLCMDIGQERTNFERAVSHWRQHQVPHPKVEVLCLSINGWYGAWDVAAVLGTLGGCIRELSLSTTQLALAFVQQQPPKNPFLHPSVRLPRINAHAIGECFATDECDQLTTTTLIHPPTPQSQYVKSDRPSWFLQLMSPFRPRFYPRSFEMLRKVNFEVSHWRSALDTEANGELFWVISWLAELPLERAENMREISILVRVGTDFCLDNTGAMTELGGYQGWGLLDMIVAHPHWRSLEKVFITVRSRTTCLCAVEEKFRALLERLKESMLPLLNARGLVDITYVPLDST